MTKKIEVFASEALPGELEAFPDIKRGWGTTKEITGGIPPMKWFNAIQKRTDEAINAIAEGSVSGYTFKDGATLNSHNDLIYDDVSKSWYFWIGDSGKVIPPNSNASEVIESDGGIWSDTNPDGLWVNIGVSPKETTFDILFAYGQSNCLGKPAMSGDTTGFPNVDKSVGLVWDVDKKALTPMVQRINSWARDSDSKSTGYAWAEFANEWHRITGRGIILVLGASGGKRISQLSKGAGLYENAIEGIQTLSTFLQGSGVKTGERLCVWHQGESDQSGNTTWEEYSDALGNLFDDLKSDTGITNFGVCIVGNPINRPETRWWVIKNAQRYLASQRDDVFVAFEGCGNFNVGDGTIGTEGVHYTQRGLNIMGQYAARSFASAVLEQKNGLPSSYINDAPRVISADYGASTARFSAVISYDSTKSQWIIRTKDTGSSNRFRSVNVESVTALGNRLRIKIAGNVSNYLNMNAIVTSSNDNLCNIKTQVRAGGSVIDVYFFADISIVVNTATGVFYSGVPWKSATQFVNNVISATTDGTFTTLTHNEITDYPDVAFLSDSAFRDLDAIVRYSCLDSNTTKISVTKLDGTTEGMVSKLAAVAFKNMVVTPSNIKELTNIVLIVDGEYLI